MEPENRRKRFKDLEQDNICDLIGVLMDVIDDQSTIIAKQNDTIAAIQSHCQRIQECGTQPGSSSDALPSAPAHAIAADQHADQAMQRPVYAVPNRVPNITGWCFTCNSDWNIPQQTPGMDEGTFAQLMTNVYENWDPDAGDNQRCFEKKNWLNKPWDLGNSLRSFDIITEWSYVEFTERAYSHFWSPSTNPTKWLFFFLGGDKHKYVTMGCIKCQRHVNIYYGKDKHFHDEVKRQINIIIGKPR